MLDSDDIPTPSEIRAFRAQRSRAELAALLDVTPLTVYRWELPPEAPESRRPRGKVLARLRAWIATQGRLAAAPAAGSPPPVMDDAPPDAALVAALHAIDGAELERAEAELLGLLSSDALRDEPSRAHASIALAKLQLLLRHDARGAFATLLGAGDPARLPRTVRLEYHVVSAFVHAHADARLFSAGRTNHHAALAEPLLGDADGERRFFLWYAQLVAAASSYDPALMARIMERLPAVRALATTRLGRVLLAEASAIATLSLTNVGAAVRATEDYLAAATEAGLPLQRLRAITWRAEAALEQAAAPGPILAALEEAEALQQRHRIAPGVHAMLLARNKGEALMRLGRLHDAELSLREAARVGAEVGFTPFRIHTTLVRLYGYEGRIDDARALAEELLRGEGVHRDLSRAVGHIVLRLCDLAAGNPAAGWFESVVAHLDDIRRLGSWAIAYRHVALHAAGVIAASGSLPEAERILALAERAAEWSPSATASAVLRLHRGRLLLRRRRAVEARRALEAAAATFEVAENAPEAALVRKLLDDAARLERESEAAGGDETPVARLLVPLQRLATRGLGAPLVLKELVNVASELLPGRALRLEEVDSTGAVTELDRRDEGGAAVLEWFELSDGLGRRLRLGVGGALDGGQRAAVSVVASTAGLALEIAGLRGFTTPRPAPGAAETVEDTALPGVVAASPSMRRLRSELARLSGSRATIIVTGESGTGKEVVARAIHDLSRRAARPYVTFNSAAVPRDLFEGQLFGYRKGAFTGATADHPGVIRAADGGTLFLDEIGELPLEVQPKLLRFLENGEVFPLGEHRSVQVDVRVIAATHRDLARLVREGRFREDLYYRLQVIPLHIPPLRERREDVLALARFFIARLVPAGRDAPVLAADGERKLVAHAWPGNVRELRNVIERSLAFDPLPPILTAEHLRI